MNRYWLALAVLLLLPGTSSGRQLPVTVTASGLNDIGDVTYELLNTGDKPIAAWTIEAKVAGANDTLARHMRLTQDNYIVEARRGKDTDEDIDAHYLIPGQPRQFVLRGSLSAAPVIEVIAAVFLDDTALGEPAAIERIFSRRASERDARRFALAQLTAVQKSHWGLAALREARTRLAVPTQPGDAEGVYAGIQQNLDLFVRHVNAGRAQEGDALGIVINLVEREYRANEAHAIRRKGGM